MLAELAVTSGLGSSIEYMGVIMEWFGYGYGMVLVWVWNGYGMYWIEMIFVIALESCVIYRTPL
jgi:hypothetical protein